MLKKSVCRILAIVSWTVLLTSCSTEKKHSNTTFKSDLTNIKTITMYSGDLNQSNEGFSSPVAQEIMRQSGVKLDIEYPSGDIAQKTGIMIASGDYPDLIMAKETAQFADADAYIDLTPYIEAYAPNLQKLYGKYMNRLKYSQADPSIYVLPAAQVDGQLWSPGMGFELQNAVVKELGFPEMKTVQDFEKAIKAYIKKYPTIDGQQTIGLSLLADDWRWLITIGNPAGFSTGVPDDGNWYIDPETYEATYRFMRPEEKEFYKWLNHMYAEGLLDPESFTQKYDQYLAKIASGRVLALIDAEWEYKSAETTLRTEGKTERTYGQYPIQMTDETKAADLRETGYLGGYGIGISVNCKDPVGAIKFLDYMASDEAQVLRFWGIEGVNYTIDSDGKRIISDEEWTKRLTDENYNKETGIGTYVYPFPAWGRGVLDSTGSTYSVDTPERIIKGYNTLEKEVLSAYGVQKWVDLYPKAEELPKSSWGAAWMIPIPSESGISVTLAKCDEIMKAGITEAIISEPERFDEIWAQTMEKINAAGVVEMNQKFTQVVKNHVAFWSDNDQK